MVFNDFFMFHSGDYYMFYTGIADSLRWMVFEPEDRWISLKIRACTVLDIYLCPSAVLQQDYFNIKLGVQNNTKAQLFCK
jgi:hypothetical protein